MIILSHTLYFQVIYIYTCGKVNQIESEHVLCEDAYFWRLVFLYSVVCVQPVLLKTL